MKRAPRQAPRPTPRKGIQRRRDSAPLPPANATRLPGTHTPNTHRPSKKRTPYGSHQPTPTSHRKSHRGWRAHLHGENGLQPHRKPQGTPPRGAPPRPYHLTTRPPQGPPHRHQKRRKARPQKPGLGTGTPGGHGTKAQAPREGNPTDTYPTHQPERHARAPRPRTTRAIHT